jgi:SAM-dependent methyltransferase
MGMRCQYCGFLLEVKDGIVRALSPTRLAYYARFIDEYERIRAAEGRGSSNDEFYISLPYKDTTGCNRNQWKIRSKSYDALLRYVIRPMAPGSLILDLGAGNCWMSFRLTVAGYRVCAVDLLTNRNDGLAAAVHFRPHLGIDIPRFQAELQNLPFSNGQFDVAVFNASFHYSDNYEKTLAEALRCLKRDGQLIIMDTPWYSSERCGEQMVAERRALFEKKYETASDSVKSMEFLTDARLRRLEQVLSIKWRIHRPWYGWRWAMRPWIARFLGQREPSQFRIYVARKRG